MLCSFLIHGNTKTLFFQTIVRQFLRRSSFITPKLSEISNDAVTLTPVYSINNTATGVWAVTLNRPEKLNSLSSEIGDAFSSVMRRLYAMPMNELRCVVLTGRGTSFCSGGDMSFLFARHHDTVENNIIELNKFYSRFLGHHIPLSGVDLPKDFLPGMLSLPVPTVVGVHGNAIGGGFCMSVASDILVVHCQSKLCANFVKIGIHSGLGATSLINNPQVAARLFLTGDTISGEEAKELGLSHTLVGTQTSNPKELDTEILTESINVAMRVAEASPIAVRSMTKTLRRIKYGDLATLESRVSEELREQAKCLPLEDFGIAYEAFRNKKKPVFP